MAKTKILTITEHFYYSWFCTFLESQGAFPPRAHDEVNNITKLTITCSSTLHHLFDAITAVNCKRVPVWMYQSKSAEQSCKPLQVTLKNKCCKPYSATLRLFFATWMLRFISRWYLFLVESRERFGQFLLLCPKPPQIWQAAVSMKLGKIQTELR